jgi:hypothetical protein
MHGLDKNLGGANIPTRDTTHLEVHAVPGAEVIKLAGKYRSRDGIVGLTSNPFLSTREEKELEIFIRNPARSRTGALTRPCSHRSTMSVSVDGSYRNVKRCVVIAKIAASI